MSADMASVDMSLPPLHELGLLNIHRSQTVPTTQQAMYQSNSVIPSSRLPLLHSEHLTGLASYPPSPTTSEESRESTPASYYDDSAEPTTSKRKANTRADSGDKSEAKKRKERNEKEVRLIFGKVRVDNEDSAFIKYGYRPSKPQTAGNGALAGLVADKRQGEFAHARVADKAIDKLLRDARRWDAYNPTSPGQLTAEQKQMAELLAWAEEGQDSEMPLDGSMMDDGKGIDATRCVVAPGSKTTCRFHGKEFRACRLERRQRIYTPKVEAQKAEFRTEAMAFGRQGRASHM